jgi:hypothetical protein
LQRWEKKRDFVLQKSKRISITNPENRTQNLL